MNAPYYPFPGNAPGARWNDLSADFDGMFPGEIEPVRSGEWVEERPLSTLLLAVSASVLGGAAWTSFFFWFFQQWSGVMIIIPLVLAAAAFATFRYLLHRLR
ncbi:MAG TPA: hypothetical protein VHM91_16595 [Verrucomicrobiales bacterium]|jgi:hypothetical protein|nr:hypothetical protein [Verrucomicrobiales bacterium]